MEEEIAWAVLRQYEQEPMGLHSVNGKTFELPIFANKKEAENH